MTQPLIEHAETLSQRAARRLRGALAENRIPQTGLARVMHLPQQKISRKVNGITPMTLDDIELFAWALEIQVDEILGVGAFEDRPIGRCAIRDSNPEPADSEPGESKLVDLGGQVVATVTDLAKVRSRIPDLVRARPALALVQGGAA